MQLRLLIPPNIESSAERDAIPIKLEIRQSESEIQAPESIPMDALGALSESERAAAFSLLQWSGGSLASFLQLTRDQLAQIVEILAKEECFYWANKPQEPIEWTASQLVGVSNFLRPASPESPSSERPSAEPDSEPAPKSPYAKSAGFEGTPMQVDGSPHFISIKLPSREHPCYREIRDLLDAYRFRLEPSNRRWWLRDRHQVLNFLGENWTDLENRYQAEFSENFLERAKPIKNVSIRMEIQEGHGSFKLSLSIAAGNASEQSIRSSLNSGRHYIESGDQIFLVKKEALGKIHSLQKAVSNSPDAPLLHNGTYSLHASRIPEISESLEAVNPNFKAPKIWRARSAGLRNLTELPRPSLTPYLEKTLRPYQKIGVSWMTHLFKYELGGILADEMGLGKTLQALALLSGLKGRRREKEVPSLSLVVCPASLVENWKREANLHCPELNVFVNHGSQRFRDQSELSDIDVLITSYGTLIRDQETLSKQVFLCIIADEAQHIKNRKTQNARAILGLNAPGRFLLTGTPIENRIQDLMSLLDFILPGGWKGIPKDARGDDRRWHERRILDQAAPYILRRSKESVAPELPEKLEHTLFIEMTPDQRSLYERARREAETDISKLEKSGGSENALRMKALTQLLRLRQICCDPRIVDGDAEPSSSAKRASFIELLEESIDGGHRILVFSQFVSILSLLRDELDLQEIGYCYIDGSTRNRMEQVDKFQSNADIPIFLISLKAGGVGLNLTAADTVIHFDPWWNPAAETQATDRAHRIGQTKVVTSYKLIVSGSVEENVLQLQATKRTLLKDVFEASEAANATLGLEDLKSLLG